MLKQNNWIALTHGRNFGFTYTESIDTPSVINEGYVYELDTDRSTVVENSPC